MAGPIGARRLWLGCVVLAGVLALGIAAPFAGPAAAQSGWWPWATDSPPAPRPPPVRREPPPQYRPPGDGYGSPGGYQPPQRGSVCLQLEQRLVDFQRQGSQPQSQLPQIENDLRQLERTLRQGESRLERSDCYDYFLFSKTLRRSRQCVDLANEVDTTRRRLAELDAQRRQLLGLGSRDRSYQDDLIRELARNGCGQQYQQEAARRGGSAPFSSLWQDEDTGPSGRGNEFKSLPFATYRTVCVRLCDGYYFPISFSTLESHFSRDLEACQSKCAAPVELYFHQNPGGAMEQAMSMSDRKPYTSLKSAFRYRKEFVQGCSCKQAEYTPSPADQGERKAEAAPSGRQSRRP
ncbi:MAG: DUF2865 domain-containing protein [Hyphomicrobiaceae bacterium]